MILGGGLAVLKIEVLDEGQGGLGFVGSGLVEPFERLGARVRSEQEFGPKERLGLGDTGLGGDAQEIVCTRRDKRLFPQLKRQRQRMSRRPIRLVLRLKTAQAFGGRKRCPVRRIHRLAIFDDPVGDWFWGE